MLRKFRHSEQRFGMLTSGVIFLRDNQIPHADARTLLTALISLRSTTPVHLPQVLGAVTAVQQQKVYGGCLNVAEL
jgi:hypothetical protein